MFINEDGTLNLETNVEKITRTCYKYGFIPNGQFQVVEDFALYPFDYFCPLNWDTRKLNKTKNTYTIHWYSASWWDEQRRKDYENEKKHELRLKTENRKQKIYYGYKSVFHYIVHLPNLILIKILGEKKYNTFKYKFKG